MDQTTPAMTEKRVTFDQTTKLSKETWPDPRVWDDTPDPRVQNDTQPPKVYTPWPALTSATIDIPLKQTTT
jgi:hypothetical protein